MAVYLLFLTRGECSVWVIDENKRERHVKNLKIGSLFGELALLKNCKRTATVISKNYSTCGAINSSAFFELI
jgi:CRP-like cAMP-binding protein